MILMEEQYIIDYRVLYNMVERKSIVRRYNIESLWNIDVFFYIGGDLKMADQLSDIRPLMARYLYLILTICLWKRFCPRDRGRCHYVNFLHEYSATLVYIYIYIYMCVCVCVCVLIYSPLMVNTIISYRQFSLAEVKIWLFNDPETVRVKLGRFPIPVVTT